MDEQDVPLTSTQVIASSTLTAVGGNPDVRICHNAGVNVVVEVQESGTSLVLPPLPAGRTRWMVEMPGGARVTITKQP